MKLAIVSRVHRARKAKCREPFNSRTAAESVFTEYSEEFRSAGSVAGSGEATGWLAGGPTQLAY